MLGQVYLEIGRDDLAAPHLAKATELGWPLHICTKASRHMMRGEVDAAFGFLKVAFADPGTDSDPLPWIHELEEGHRIFASAFAAAGNIYFGTSTSDTEDPCEVAGADVSDLGKLYSFSMEGDPKFEQAVGNMIVSPTVCDRHIYIKTPTGGGG